MKKFIYIILFLLFYIIGRTYIGNYQSINSLIKISKNNYYSKKTMINEQQKLNELKIKTKKQNQEKKVEKKLQDFLLNRYHFKYNDYRVKYIKIQKIKNGNIYYVKVTINYNVRKVTTLLTVISMFYKEKFIEKIEIKNKYQINLYLNKNKLILSKKFKNYKKEVVHEKRD